MNNGFLGGFLNQISQQLIVLTENSKQKIKRKMKQQEIKRRKKREEEEKIMRREERLTKENKREIPGIHS